LAFAVSAAATADLLAFHDHAGLPAFHDHEIAGVLLAFHDHEIAKSPGEPTAEAIERWVADLDDPSFAVRRSATRHLQQAGFAAIEPLAIAADGDRAEVAQRTVEILDKLCRSTESRTEIAARAALKRLSASSHALAAQPAAATLRSQRITDQRRAREAIQRMGGEVTPIALEDGEFIFGEVTLGKTWTGGEEGLEHLPRLGRVQLLLLYGATFTDESLAKVKELTDLQMIKLYATEVTDDGEEQLRKAFPGAKIDRRRGAMLGVSGSTSTDPPGCRVEWVLANGGAASAGIEAGDVITKIGAEPVRDLQSMIAIIAKYKTGDQVPVEFVRGFERMTRDVVFGEMQLDALR
jgi:hypothetical protein